MDELAVASEGAGVMCFLLSVAQCSEGQSHEIQTSVGKLWEQLELA